MSTVNQFDSNLNTNLEVDEKAALLEGIAVLRHTLTVDDLDGAWNGRMCG